MKYIDAVLLRKDIDNWKKAMADAVGEYSDGVRFALEHFTFILDSLQQEQPDIIDYICLCAGIPAPFMDGNQWCILKGDNIQVGVVGFGDTKEDALINFIKDIPLQHEPAKGIDGVVHHYLNTHWIVTDKKQLATALKVFHEGAEVELFIFAKKEGAK